MDAYFSLEWRHMREYITAGVIDWWQVAYSMARRPNFDFFVLMKKRAETDKYIPYIVLGIVVGIAAFVLAALELMPPTGYLPPPTAHVRGTDAIIGGSSAAPEGDYSKVGLPYIESGYRFQFSKCHGTPGSLVVKLGRYFLLDNRDAQSHTFALAGHSYSVGGYGASVAAVWKTGKYQITCDGGGAAALTVEK